jgi:hypothetical protein
VSSTPKLVGTTTFALYLTAIPTAAYVAYLTQPGESDEVARELAAELGALDERMKIDVVESSPGAAHLLELVPACKADFLIVGAERYAEADWRLLDRRRSALARERMTVLLTTPASFSALMRVAPNLASWLGGFVFTHEDPGGLVEAQRARRLSALRAWAGKTDEEVLLAAEEGRLPRDPEYAAWLVLLGRGDLLDA